MNELEIWTKNWIDNNPEHKAQAKEFLQLCKDEIEQGSSRLLEIELCKSAIEELTKEEEL